MPRHRVGELERVYDGFGSGDLTTLFERFDELGITEELQVIVRKMFCFDDCMKLPIQNGKLFSKVFAKSYSLKKL